MIRVFNVKTRSSDVGDDGREAGQSSSGREMKAACLRATTSFRLRLISELFEDDSEVWDMRNCMCQEAKLLVCCEVIQVDEEQEHQNASWSNFEVKVRVWDHWPSGVG